MPPMDDCQPGGRASSRTNQANREYSLSTYKGPNELSSTSSVLALITIATSAVAIPVNDVVVITPITAPDAGAVWPVGSVQTITWDVATIPTGSQDATGFVLLGYLEDGSSNEHLDVQHPLAENFLLTNGGVNVTVPNVATRDDYIVVLFGDSGNKSPKFTIQ